MDLLSSQWVIDKIANNGMALGMLIVFWVIYKFAPDFLKRLGLIHEKDQSTSAIIDRLIEQINKITGSVENNQKELNLFEINHLEHIKEDIKKLQENDEKLFKNYENISKELANLEGYIRGKFNGNK